MAVAIHRKPDAGGVRIDVIFDDREDAEMTYMQRNRESLIWRVDTRTEGRKPLTPDAVSFMLEAAVLAARAYLDLDPLDQPPPTCSAPGADTPGAGRRASSRGSRRAA